MLCKVSAKITYGFANNTLGITLNGHKYEGAPIDAPFFCTRAIKKCKNKSSPPWLILGFSGFKVPQLCLVEFVKHLKLKHMNELFKNITWSQFMLSAVVLFILYYFVVGLLYFRHELLNRIKEGSLKKGTGLGDNELQDEEPINDLTRLIEEIGHSILVPGKEATKSKLLGLLKASVANISWLSDPGYRYALNNAIIEMARTNCGISFSEEELSEAWDELSR